MASVNEGFVPDDSKESSQSSTNNGILSDEIDYSKAAKKPIIIAALAATFGAFVLGTLLGWSSPVQPQLQNGTSLSPDNIWYINLNNDEMSWVGSLVTLGALIGALSAGVLMDRFGRKTVLLAISVPYAVGWVLIIAAVDPSMLYIGRILGGFAGGICSVVAPSYVGEISIPSIRGLLGFFFQLMVCTGILVVSLFGLGLHWRWISAISAIFPLIFLAAVMYVPESPYFLVKKGRQDDARVALQWLRGADFEIQAEMRKMEANVQVELSQSARFSDLFQPWALKPVLVAIGLMFFQQVSGINAALFNAVEIFQSSGSTISGLVSAVILNVTQLSVTLVSSSLVERLGRKLLFLVSNIMMCISMFALGTFFYIQANDPETAKSLGWLPLTSLILFIATFAIGAGPMPWLLTGEILPAKVKAPATSIATFTNWFLAFIVTKTFVDIQAGLTKAGSFWLFGGFCVLGVLFSIFALPETKDKTPEEIQAFFGIKPMTSSTDHLQQASPSRLSIQEKP
jgi:SP family facilitated glucose transporter-like MFS transporter 8